MAAPDPTRQSGAWIAGVALVVRVAVALWGSRFPPAGDGFYYDAIARRIALGEGYTWVWPDETVTFAAHYPVGYPAIVGAFYAIFGARPLVAMLVNAGFGAAGAFALHRLLAASTTPRRALAGGLMVALHPALVPYTVALMTEGIASSLLCIAAALAHERRVREGRGAWIWMGATGLAIGAATLVRPQCLVLAPVLGALSVASSAKLRTRLARAALVSAFAIACCLPWTARNCARMDRCALVSVNGGWNLLIGAQTTSGAWEAVDVPPECREVWSESAKDSCFERAARSRIAAHPAAWLAKIPRKLGVTFDYFGGAPWYLHMSNPGAFSNAAKIALGAVETVLSRVALGFALVACARLVGPRRRARRAVAAVGLVAAASPFGWIGYLACAASVLLLGGDLRRCPVLVPWTASVIFATALLHAVFFGAGRYGLVVAPFIVALAFVAPAAPEPGR